MRNNSVLAVILSGGLVLGSAGVVCAQDLAMATAGPSEGSKSAFVVFADKDGRTLSPTALRTVSMAADEARAGGKVTLMGRAEETSAVKQALLRRGVSDESIVVRPALRAPIAEAGDGLSDPVSRRVEIRI